MDLNPPKNFGLSAQSTILAKEICVKNDTALRACDAVPEVRRRIYLYYIVMVT